MDNTDFEQIGKHYKSITTDTEQRAKALAVPANEKGIIKVMVGKAGLSKALYLTAEQFAAFKRGFE